jgi:flagellar biosynthetic protein FliP
VTRWPRDLRRSGRAARGVWVIAAVRRWPVALGAAAALVAPPALAQSLSVDLGTGGTVTGQLVRLVLLITVLSLAPSILVMVTSFTRIVVVLAFLRSALGLQQTPPNAVLISLALFITAFVMAPTLERAWEDGLAPLLAEEIDEHLAFERAMAPLRDFMLGQVRGKDLELFLDISRTPALERPEEAPLRALIPAFMISELRRAFEIGFLIFVPFLVIDMVVASVLMSMGMMMLPPVLISLPFKLIFFVLVDGWFLVVGSLVESFAR